MKKILLGFRFSEDLENIKKDLLEIYNEKGIEVSELAEKYNIIGIRQFLNDHRDYTDLIIMEHLEMHNPITLNYLDDLTDEFEGINIVVILKDNHFKSKFTQSLYTMGLYNCIFEKDASLEEIVERTIHKRVKRLAKEYYGVADTATVEGSTVSHIVSEEQIASIINYLQKNLQNKEEVSQNYDYIVGRYTEKQNIYIISKLPDDIKSHLSENMNYIKFYGLLNIGESNKPIDVPDKEKVIKKVKKGSEEPEFVVQTKEIVRTVEKTRHALVEKVHIQRQYVVPEDYKKIVGILGTGKVGSTFLCSVLANEFENRKIPVAVGDLQSNRGLFSFFKPEERKAFVDGKKQIIPEAAIAKLIDGVNEPWLEHNYISLYTNNPEQEYQKISSEIFKGMVQKVMENHAISLWDYGISSFQNDQEFNNSLFICNQIIVVIDGNPGRLEEQKKFLLHLKEHVDFGKILFIVNNHIPGVIKKHLIRKYFEQNTDICLREIYYLPLSQKDYAHSYGCLLYNKPMDNEGLSKQMKRVIKKVGERIYPKNK